MNNRNAKLWVYEDTDKDVVPPFLVGEVAGSLSIESDRAQIRLFAENLLEWLARTDTTNGASIYRFCRDRDQERSR